MSTIRPLHNPVTTGVCGSSSPRSAGFRTLLLLAPLVAGCASNNGGAGGVDDSNPQATSTLTERCNVPGAKVIAPLQAYENGYDDRNARAERLQVDGDTLFFAAGKQLYSVPLSGGSPKHLYTAETTIGVFWAMEDEILVGPARGDSLEVIPRAGGAASSTITLPAEYGAERDIVLAPDRSTFFIKSNRISRFDYWRHDWKSGESQELLSASELGYSGPVVPQGDYLYVGQRPTKVALAATELYRLPIAGGEPEAVPVEGDFEMELVGSDDENLYFVGELADTSPGIYRLPPTGGKPELVITPDNFSIVGVAHEQTVFANLSGRAVVSFDAALLELPRTGEGSTLFTLGCFVSGFASTDDEAIIAVKDNTDQIEIIRAPLP